MGIEAIYCKPRTSIADKTHRKYPYLLRELDITQADRVWCADICFEPPHGSHPCGAAMRLATSSLGSYIPMQKGHAYLCAVMDWHTRCVLGWAVSNTMDTSLCLLALERAKSFAGCVPTIFN